MTCLRCGNWMAPPAAVVPVDQSRAAALCSVCGNRQSFVYFPVAVEFIVLEGTLR